jgi:hypothetical protein
MRRGVSPLQTPPLTNQAFLGRQPRRPSENRGSHAADMVCRPLAVQHPAIVLSFFD